MERDHLLVVYHQAKTITIQSMTIEQKNAEIERLKEKCNQMGKLIQEKENGETQEG